MKNKIIIALFIIGAILLVITIANKLMHHSNMDLIFKLGLGTTGLAILLSLIKMFDTKNQHTSK